MAKNPSRADRYANAQSKAADAKSMMEDLRDELQNWRDNLPENLQGGQKASDLDEAIDQLEFCIGQLEEVENAEVSFPTMFG